MEVNFPLSRRSRRLAVNPFYVAQKRTRIWTRDGLNPKLIHSSAVPQLLYNLMGILYHVISPLQRPAMATGIGYVGTVRRIAVPFLNRSILLRQQAIDIRQIAQPHGRQPRIKYSSSSANS